MAFAQAVKNFSKSAGSFLGISGEYDDSYDESYDEIASETTNRVTSKSPRVHAGPAHSIVTLYPTSYSEAPHIAEALNDGCITTLNLSKLSKDETRQIVSYASGVIDGIHGSIERIDTHVFILTPNSVEILETMN